MHRSWWKLLLDRGRGVLWPIHYRGRPGIGVAMATMMCYAPGMTSTEYETRPCADCRQPLAPQDVAGDGMCGECYELEHGPDPLQKWAEEEFCV